MEFFKTTDYRKCLRWALERLNSRGEKITNQDLAEAIRVQSPYLSKVLNGNADLSEDQLYLACTRLKLNTDEEKYLKMLLALARTSLKERKDELQKEISVFQEMKLSPSENRNAKKLVHEAQDLSAYYLDPWAQIIHMYLTIPKWRKNPLALVEKTQLAPEKLSAILKTLEDLHIIEFKNGVYSVLKDQLHLQKSSPLCGPQQSLMRSQALHRTQSIGSNGYSFLATFTADDATRLQIQHHFVDFLKKVEKLVADAPAEEVYQVQFDLFPWA